MSWHHHLLNIMVSYETELYDVVIICIQCTRGLLATDCVTISLTRDLPDDAYNGCIGVYTICKRCEEEFTLTTRDRELPGPEDGTASHRTSDIWSMYISSHLHKSLQGDNICEALGYDDSRWSTKKLVNTERIRDTFTTRSKFTYINSMRLNSGRLMPARLRTIAEDFM